MVFPSLLNLKAMLGELSIALALLLYLCRDFSDTMWIYAGCIKELFLSGADKFLVSAYFLFR